MNAISQERNQNLDALRGIAAIFVVFLHAKSLGLIDVGFLFSKSYLAVDFFFCLSGFVISKSYQHKIILNKMDPWEFLKIRLLRFSPMLMVSGFFIFIIFGFRFLNGSVDFYIFLTNFFSNLFLIPLSSLIDFYLNSGHKNISLFFNVSLWSLFYEVLVNIFFVWIFLKFNKFYKYVFFILLTFVFFVIFNFNSVDYGPTLDLKGVVGGLGRSFFCFFLGWLVFNYLSNGIVVSKFIYYFSFIFFNYLLVFSLNIPDIFIILFFPIFIAISIGRKGQFSQIKSILGKISFPLYVMHFPILCIIKPFFLDDFSIYLIICICIFLSYFVSKYIDIPLQASFKKINFHKEEKVNS